MHGHKSSSPITHLRDWTPGRFHPTESALARVWAGQVWLAAHGALALAHSGVLPVGANRFLLADMIARLAVGYASIPQTMRSEPSR